MQSVVLVNKPVGFTPLQAVYAFKSKNSDYQNQTIGYAGRLDPMAEGLLLLLVGEENKKRKEYENLHKTYEFSMLLGVSTDTYDLMGLVTKADSQKAVINTEEMKRVLPTFIATITLPYPPYSSRTVRGIPLYRYARENRLTEIKIPTKKATISAFELLSSSLLPTSELLSYISRIIPHVTGNFRQEEIVKKWHDSSSLLPTHLPKFDFKITCSSGTYVRGIVQEIGNRLNIPTVTYSITRTQIGSYTLEQAETF